MGSLDLWGAIAASFLLVQCVVFNLIWVGLALGLWKGSEWLHTHAGTGLDKVGQWVDKGLGYVRLGESYLAAPFVRSRARAAGLRAMWERLRG